MKRILIDGREADLSEAPIAINWEYLNLSEPGKKYSPYTSSLTLPFTPKNKSIMGFADVVGGNPAAARDIQDVDIWLGPLRFIRGGTLKILSSAKEGYLGTVTSRNQYIEAIEAYTLDEAIADCAATFTYAAYADAIDALRTGTVTAVNKGFILPRTLEGSISTSTWTIYSTANGHTHEVWLSAAAIITQMIAEGVMTLKVWESGASVAIASSDLWTDLGKLYLPCWNWVLYDGGSAWTLELASGERLIAGDVIDRSQLVTFGGKTSWEFIKSIAQIFCAAIYQDADEITLVPLNNISSAGAVDLTGKCKPLTKYYTVPGHGSSNYIRYKNTDNLTDDFARMNISVGIKPLLEKELLTFDLMLPGQYFVVTHMKKFFDTNVNGNGELLTTPMLLFDDGEQAIVTVTHGSDTAASIYLKVLSYYDFTPWWSSYNLISIEGIAYDAEIGINHYLLSKLRPWLLVRINELGGLFYLNKISGYDPDSGKPARCQVIKWAGGEFSITPASFTFAYNGQTGTITIVSNILWVATYIGDGVSLDKESGTGNDTVTVTVTDDNAVDTTIEFSFGGVIEEITADMPAMEINSISAIGTQYRASAFSPAPTVNITSIPGGARRVFWAIYKGGVITSIDGYCDLTLGHGTADYTLTGVITTSQMGTDFTLRVGYSADSHPIVSNKFTITLP